MLTCLNPNFDDYTLAFLGGILDQTKSHVTHCLLDSRELRTFCPWTPQGRQEFLPSRMHDWILNTCLVEETHQRLIDALSVAYVPKT